MADEQTVAAGRRVCVKCQKEMRDTEFYQYKDGHKTDMCKKCLTMHIDNFDPETYLWILKELDVPYIPEEWNVLRDRAFAKDPQKMNGMSVIGKYLAKMRLKMWKDYGWEDTEKLQQQALDKANSKKAEAEAQEAYAKEAFANHEISEAQYKTMISTTTQNAEYKPPAPDVSGLPQFYDVDNFPDFAAELTDDDKLQLALKWGRYYSPADWVALEKDYKDMEESFDIQDQDTRNTLILICKNNLKMNQAIDTGNIEEYQKLSRIQTDLRKTAKFTAAQNKEKKEEFADSAGVLVAYCEKWGGQIPRFKIDAPLDIIDTIIRDNKQYLHDLVYEDTALAQQIEDYLKRREIAEQEMRDKALAKICGKSVDAITDEDIIKHRDAMEKLKEESNKISAGEVTLDEHEHEDGEDEAK